jgi:hypothetical protein
MKNTLMIGLAATSLLLGAQPCLARYMASLSTTAPDLNNLTVGQKVTFDVNLSGIGSPADNLDFLAATVKFDGSLLGTSTITPGGIVPDLTGFQSTSKTGLADANYDTLFATSGKPIASNGTFYFFDATVQGTGSGRVSSSSSAPRPNDVGGQPRFPGARKGVTLPLLVISGLAMHGDGLRFLSTR